MPKIESSTDPFNFFHINENKDHPEPKIKNHTKNLKIPQNQTINSLTNKEQSELRKKLRIHIKGNDTKPLILSFYELWKKYRINKRLYKNILRLNYKNPTPIQMQAIPILLNRRDLFGIAPTGSGKTAAFVIPMINQISKSKKIGIKGLIISPTRELSIQIHNEVIKLVRKSNLKPFLLISGIDPNQISIKEIDILVATPFTLYSLIIKKKICLNKVKYLILDEADRLLDNNTMKKNNRKKNNIPIIKQIDRIIEACTHKKLQKALFSATLPDHIESLARTILCDPIRLIIGGRGIPTTSVEQSLKFVGTDKSKLFTLKQLLSEGIEPPVLIFVQSKKRALDLYNELHELYNVDYITSNRSKEERDNIIINFHSGTTWILICTDLMARGIDFQNIMLVINFDFPPSVVEYIHRIGRTGRAGKFGKAITFFTDKDRLLLRNIAVVIKKAGGIIPDWILGLNKINRSRRKHLKLKPPKRAKIKDIGII